MALPSYDELEAAWTALADVDEDHLQVISQSVLAASKSGPACFQEVGQLTWWVNQMRGLMQYMRETLDEIERATIYELAQIAAQTSPDQ